MSGLVIRNKNGENISYSGSQYDGLENIGKRHLCIRTGSEENSIIKYGLSTVPSSHLKMKIGNTNAYIAKKYSTSQSATTLQSITCTSSSVSNYVSSATLATASSSKLSTGTATRTSNYISSSTLKTASSSKTSTRTSATITNIQNYTYYGTTPIKTTVRRSTTMPSDWDAEYINSTYTKDWHGIVSISGNFLESYMGSNPSENIVLASSTTDYGELINTVWPFGTVSLTRTAYLYTTNNEYMTSVTRGEGLIREYNITFSKEVQPGGAGTGIYKSPSLWGVWSATKTISTVQTTATTVLSTASSSKLSTKSTTRASTYTSSQTLSTASSSSLSTNVATRTSMYNTSSNISVSTTKSIITNNVNL